MSLKFSSPASVSAAGLAVGLGIGAIAEVAKQSLGGKQKGGKDDFTALLSADGKNSCLILRARKQEKRLCFKIKHNFKDNQNIFMHF